MFNRIKHRKFDYIPRYYDPAKEELEQRMAQYKEGADGAERAKAGIKTGFSRKTTVKQSALKKSSLMATARLLLIIAILLVLSIKLLESDSLQKIIETFEN